jgi:hypothetical protein
MLLIKEGKAESSIQANEGETLEGVPPEKP